MDIVFPTRNRNLEWQLTFVPAAYFMLLGLTCLGFDLLHNTINWFQTSFYATFLLPMIFRRRRLYQIFGIFFSVLWLYLIIAGLMLMPGNAYLTTLQTWGVAAWLLFSFLCSVSLWYIGVHRIHKRNLS
jgi:hypothetical protein